VRAHPELRDRLWTNVRRLRQGLRELGYVIGETESPIVPILSGDERRTIALWQRLLADGLYVNLIVPPGCQVDECVLRASCSAAHTPEQVTTALDIFARASCLKPALLPVPHRGAREAFAKLHLRDDAQTVAQPVDATDESFR
jgi:8-amino-7-oxononanoate synthase